MSGKLDKFVPVFEEFSRDYFQRVQDPQEEYYNKPSYVKQDFGKDLADKSIKWVYDDASDKWVLHIEGSVTGAMLDRWKQKNPKPESPRENAQPAPELAGIQEKWEGGADIEQTGEYSGKTIGELQSMHDELSAKKDHTAEDTKKLRQINFAIRAKRDWKGGAGK